MKALTLWQPYATAIALGIKTVETRPPWALRLRALVGDDVAIHAAKQEPQPETIGGWEVVPSGWRGTARTWTLERYMPGRPLDEDAVERHPLTFGAVVAVARIAAVVPMWAPNLVERPDEGGVLVGTTQDAGRLLLWRSGRGASDPEDVTSQRPWGIYEPGRVAVVLDHVRPLSEPVPCRGYQQAWNLPGWTLAAVEMQMALDQVTADVARTPQTIAEFRRQYGIDA